MNQHQTITPPALHERDFVLATDLDGTFLGGSEDDRETLYGWIEDNRATIGLVFVTGRDPEFIADICDGTSVPWPDYVIGDVGTTIASVDASGSIAPIGALEEDIARRWGNRGDRVRETLDGHPGLKLQATPFRYRVSYDLDAAGYHPDAADKIAALGLDHLISDNRFFDVLPKGVSKGPSLKRLVAHLGIDGQRVLAAGDTLNDLSMLECGLPAVAVGNAEDALVERVSPLDHVFMASAHGAGGILEAIAALNLHPTPKG